MGFFQDLRTLATIALHRARGKSHQERLESFYGPQADAYDNTRRKLLKGREELFGAVPVPKGGVWLDIGGATGANLENLGPRIAELSKVYIVDLSRPLLEIAKKRIADRGWTNVETLEADATIFEPPVRPVQVVSFSYSLTMIPDWFAAIDRAYELLEPGGLIAVVDFYVARKWPEAGRVKHGWLTRQWWPMWFSTDNVFPSSDHVPYLHRKFEPVRFTEHRARLWGLPMLKVPYYNFIGRKPLGSGPAA
jgi:S-adenosylmethionine-diacylgycerolhomoserine-N-methlytransferase